MRPPPPDKSGAPPQPPQSQAVVLHAVRAMHGDLQKLGGKVTATLDIVRTSRQGLHPRWQLLLCSAIAFAAGMVAQQLLARL